MKIILDCKIISYISEKFVPKQLIRKKYARHNTIFSGKLKKYANNNLNTYIIIKFIKI